ncbi:MAG: glycosyltransferase family 4 protein [Chloroflexaceae bacterium]|nr:glycosyltransferase family 4 protein [Chloroflexaceae bacterium]
MDVLLPSDVFPPGHVGGAAWSAYTLARALIERGHRVTALVPYQVRQRRAEGLVADTSGAVPTLRYGYRAPSWPIIQNYYRHERLWQPLAAVLLEQGRQAQAQGHRLLIHAQHVQTAPAAVMAGQRLGVPVVVTVRDHWPWDYFATGLHGNQLPYEQRAGRRWAALCTDLPGRLGPLQGSLACLAVPWMLAHLQRRQLWLAQATMVLAVSQYIATRLVSVLPQTPITVLPNMVDRALVQQIAVTPPTHLPEGPFLLYVGKLEKNKGADLLVPTLAALADRHQQEIAAGRTPELPVRNLVIIGNGSLQLWLRAELERLVGKGLDLRLAFLNWVDHDDVLRFLARCAVLLFPSGWGEPLSRVLLEASSLGVPIVAMPTGGTPEVVIDGETGRLGHTPAQLAQHLWCLLQNPEERKRLGQNAQLMARQRFAADVVGKQIEDLYYSLAF